MQWTSLTTVYLKLQEAYRTGGSLLVKPSIALAAGQIPGIGYYESYGTSLGTITLSSSSSTEPNIVYAISGQNVGFTVDENNVYLNDNWYYDKGWVTMGLWSMLLQVADMSGDIPLSIAVSGDVSGSGSNTVIATDGDYFGLDGARITASGGHTTPLTFNSFGIWSRTW